jgi:uncharacterized protein
MRKLALTDFSLRHPWIVVILTLALIGGLGAQFPKVSFDNDPENMLSEDEHVRVFHNQVKERFRLYDFVIVGIVNEQHEDGVFNPSTLRRIDDLTRELISLHPGENGRPTVLRPARGDEPAGPFQPDLQPDNQRKRVLAKVFRHDVNHLFHDGESVIITPEIISPSVVDNIRQAEFGRLAIEYLMEEPPATREEALRLREDAMNNPLYKGTLVSEDGRALCLYIPILEKTYSYNVANLIESLTEDWPEQDRVYITGLPVAEDTFGVEMLIQMATSAPLAGLAIFLLLLFFFKRLSLVIPPMIVAIVSVVSTMGLLIGLGFDVHIMSSMIAIFLMPIAVADSIHILSEFFDLYYRFQDKGKTVRHVIGHLFMPMLYTSLTTMAGFASLSLTPIPPVKVFGLHVAFGVGLAWLLTMTLIPAYIMLFVREKTLGNLCRIPESEHSVYGEACRPPRNRLTAFLEWLGSFSYLHWKLIIALTLLLVGVSAVGISRINVNDNPVKWFTPTHRIRIADQVLNDHFSGTYTAYLVLEPAAPDRITCGEKAAVIRREARDRFGDAFPEATQRFMEALDRQEEAHRNLGQGGVQRCLMRLVEEARAIDESLASSWNVLAETVLYLDPEGLTIESLRAALEAAENARPKEREMLLNRLRDAGPLEGSALQDRALAVCDEYTALSFEDFVFAMEAELTAPLFKRPDMLAWVEELEAHLESHENVGKINTAVDALKKAHYELNYREPPPSADEETRRAAEERNQSFFRIPETAAGTGQVFTQLEGMKKKDSLFHLVTRDYQDLNLWFQLQSGDNKDMETVVQATESYLADLPPPVDLSVDWAGLTYINVVWQDKMVVGMLSSLASSFVTVLVMMMVLFRSPLFGLLSMIPLSVTIAFIYGLIGLVGKDYDMPVAVLSALTLGLSVDFAIHFLQRAREIRAELGSWKDAVREMFKEPAIAISRNAIVISIGFTPLLVAPLVPYKTVGFFLATIMAVSWLSTLFILAALVTALRRRLFGKGITTTPEGGNV